MLKELTPLTTIPRKWQLTGVAIKLEPAYNECNNFGLVCKFENSNLEEDLVIRVVPSGSLGHYLQLF